MSQTIGRILIKTGVLPSSPAAMRLAGPLLPMGWGNQKTKLAACHATDFMNLPLLSETVV